VVPPFDAPRQLPLETQALFSELLERLKGLEFQRTFGELAGSFGKKTKGLHKRVGRKIRSRLADQPGLMRFMDQLSR